MFERLQKKWKVSPGRLLLILITFALGGSATGYLGKRVMSFIGIENPWIYVPIYIIIVTIIWPLMVLIVSIPFGQFSFFKSYIAKLGSRISGRKISHVQPDRESISGLITNPNDPIQLSPGNPTTKEARPRLPKHIAIFASGTGSNAQKLIDHFGTTPSLPGSQHVEQPAIVKLIVSNKADAGVLNIARHNSIPILLIEKEKFFRGNAYVDELKEHDIDLIILAGFLWKIPQALIAAYPNGIINIHPALLPKYGGKGFYGKFVHEAVIKAGEKESGITIHFVDEQYDHGGHIFQSKVVVSPDDTPETLAKKIQQLEHEHFPRVIEELIQKQNRR
ncbi:MAG TPA: phosphoribosylglycinamide formyltransferase [Chitinophagaceae bacterium]